MKVPFSRYLELMRSYMYPQRWLLLVLTTGLTCGIGMQLVNPQILRYFIDSAIDTSATAPPMSSVTLAALAYLALAIFGQVIGIGNSYLSSLIGWNSTNALREDLASHCLRLDMSFHKSKTPGELIQRIDGDVGVLGNFFSTFLINILTNVAMLIGTLFILFSENLTIGAVLTGSSVILFGVIYAMRSLAVEHNKAMFEAMSSFYGFIEERLAGKEDIRALDGIPYVLRRLYEKVRHVYRKSLSSGYINNVISWTMMFCMALNQAIALGIGAYLYLQGDITLGTVFMIIQYLNMLMGPLLSISNQVQALQQFRASVERVEELFSTERKIVDGNGPDLPQGPLRVEFDHVSFSYEPDNPTLTDITFSLEQGEVLGLLGKTGSGKSTIARMLFRFYDPDQGVIRLQGRPLRECGVHHLRSHVGMVTQDVQLFRATMRDNLTFFDPDVDDAVIVDAIDRLGLTSWLNRLSDGLDTKIGTSDIGLSAGEAQLLAFTRAFLNRPGLLILDEASSRLDPATEQLMESAMDELLDQQTAIIIAHRLDTVRRADRIVILDEGRIVESGARLDLENDPDSKYSELLRVGMQEVLS
ncbi:MAG: ABC transporter ATP-binding protein [Proteobacteria bacterium]|nr:ABC transporter ATP-binding protein [Pseudomonadota bacterium]MDA1298825.1 ABC transporter ATP-binding protein [Pseudomonadota bacterium]